MENNYYLTNIWVLKSLFRIKKVKIAELNEFTVKLLRIIAILAIIFSNEVYQCYETIYLSIL